MSNQLKSAVAAKIAARKSAQTVPVTIVAPNIDANNPMAMMQQMMQQMQMQMAQQQQQMAEALAKAQAELSQVKAAPSKAIAEPIIVFRASSWAKTGDIWELSDASKDTDTRTHNFAAMSRAKWLTILDNADVIRATLEAAPTKTKK